MVVVLSAERARKGYLRQTKYQKTRTTMPNETPTTNRASQSARRMARAGSVLLAYPVEISVGVSMIVRLPDRFLGTGTTGKNVTRKMREKPR